ncbi:MAG: GNAT family N-acetyltransferase [Chitinophagales bacterium]|jgi:ribosomal protein S18 acetylase RimI-like enzyme|nr:GNAT family N-acetyltransferase [Bacteroidota bacterium]MBK7567794.1 GNAT family N-acetyltransferase [Bacteroidota bacterium]MBP8916290.1 GNAT family N-acetyltransferase [Chitinophagales bacterium]MBP9221714.1 GNAT family N-acetyltransferase [Chitinophagales bacterium]
MEHVYTEEIKIRKASPDDLSGLCSLCAETFYDTYQQENTSENMQLYINTHFSPEVIGAELKTKNITIFIAFKGEKMIGYIKLEVINSTYMAEGSGCEISRYYVIKEYQQYKVGKKLMNITENFALESSCNYLWLGVWQKNEKAIAIYKHLGFIISGTTTFTLGDDVQDDFIMIKSL